MKWSQNRLKLSKLADKVRNWSDETRGTELSNFKHDKKSTYSLGLQ